MYPSRAQKKEKKRKTCEKRNHDCASEPTENICLDHSRIIGDGDVTRSVVVRIGGTGHLYVKLIDGGTSPLCGGGGGGGGGWP